MLKEDQIGRFEQTVLPHLDAAYNFARWLIGDRQDAEDLVQEAYLRAFKFFDGFHGTDGRAWLLTIVRNTCYSWLQQNRELAHIAEFDEELHVDDEIVQSAEYVVFEQVDHDMIHQALTELPAEFREALVLREMEELSYKEIALITKVPLGTVMSRLARGRKLLHQIMMRKEA